METEILIQGDREVTEHFLFNINEKVRHVIILFVYYVITGYAKFLISRRGKSYKDSSRKNKEAENPQKCSYCQ